MKNLTAMLCLTITIVLLHSGDGRAAGVYMYCAGETENGESWEGVCYLYSDQYGELESAETEDGKEVTGECYKYSSNYAEIESAETEDGEEATGECYF